MRKTPAFVLSLLVTLLTIYALAKTYILLIFLPAIYGIFLTLNRLLEWPRKDNNKHQKEHYQKPIYGENYVKLCADDRREIKKSNNLNPLNETTNFTQDMDYNPFSKDLASLEKALSDSSIRARHLRTQLNWLQKTDIVELNDRLASHRKLLGEASKNKSLEDLKIETTLMQINGLPKNLMSPLNPFGWINARQAELRTEIDLFNRRLLEQKKRNGSFIRAQAESNHAISQIEKDIKQHNSLDKTQIHNEIQEICAHLVKMEQEHKKLYEKHEAAAQALDPIHQQIEGCEAQITETKKMIAWAKSLEQRLNRAANSYERRLIHEECKSKFQQGSPATAIERQEKLLEKFERDLAKLHKRVLELSKRLSLEIRRIVIDGNNLCFEEDKFIGLSPLLSLTKVLTEKIEISLVFDASIRGLLNMGHDVIREQFNKKVRVHVVATRQKAPLSSAMIGLWISKTVRWLKTTD